MSESPESAEAAFLSCFHPTDAASDRRRRLQIGGAFGKLPPAAL